MKHSSNAHREKSYLFEIVIFVYVYIFLIFFSLVIIFFLSSKLYTELK